MWNTYGSGGGALFMYKHFTACWRNLANGRNSHQERVTPLTGRVWTLVTSCFSQRDIFHLLMNMMVLWFMGRPMINFLGNTRHSFWLNFGSLPKRFVGIYFLGGISSSLLHIAYENWLGPVLDSSKGRLYDTCSARLLIAIPGMSLPLEPAALSCQKLHFHIDNTEQGYQRLVWAYVSNQYHLLGFFHPGSCNHFGHW